MLNITVYTIFGAQTTFQRNGANVRDNKHGSQHQRWHCSNKNASNIYNFTFKKSVITITIFPGLYCTATALLIHLSVFCIV